MPDLYSINDGGKINYMHEKSGTIPISFHLHDGFEIYFLISGDVNYFIEKRMYPLKYGDLIITNNYEVHTPSFRSDKTYERIILQFKPEVAERLSLPQFNLLHCFMNRPLGSFNKISFVKSQLEELLRLFERIENADKSGLPGSEIIKLSAFSELLVFLNRKFINNESIEEHPSVPEKLEPILDYIDSNLENDLSLKSLGNRFYINSNYLCRLFKDNTGVNLHEYIIFKRISKAKKLLSTGFNVTDSCMMCGFIDYANFLRVFKKVVGVTPGQFRKFNSK